MCQKIKLPIALIRWISFFPSERFIQLRFNGKTQPRQRVRIGILQGLLISLILFPLYVRDICKTRPDAFTFFSINNNYIRASLRLTEKLKQILKVTARAIL